MEFRWAAGIALWTILSGPVFAPLTGAPSISSKTPKRAVMSGKVKVETFKSPKEIDLRGSR
jgi:hypothetical protein